MLEMNPADAAHEVQAALLQAAVSICMNGDAKISEIAGVVRKIYSPFHQLRPCHNDLLVSMIYMLETLLVNRDLKLSDREALESAVGAMAEAFGLAQIDAEEGNVGPTVLAEEF